MSGAYSGIVTKLSELNNSNCQNFISDYARKAFIMAIKGFRDKSRALECAEKALVQTVCVESGASDSRSLSVEDGLRRAVMSYMNQEQSKRMLDESHQDGRKIDWNSQLTDAEEEALIKRVNMRITKNTPRYAPRFTGTQGTLIILSIVALIIAAIVFIWINPFEDKLPIDLPTVSGSDTVYASPAARISGRMLASASSEVITEDEEGNAFNAGLPVIISVKGIDANDSLNVTVSNDDGTNYAVYQLDSGKYCFTADRDQIYHAVFSNNEGASMSYYVIVSGTGARIDDILAADYCAVRFGGESEVDLFSGRQGLEPVSGKQTADDERQGTVRIKKSPSGFSSLVGEDGRSIAFSGKTETGIKSIVLDVTGADGAARVLTLPVIVADNVPVLSDESRNVTIKHTPSHAGTLCAKLSAYDIDGDGVTYALSDSENCTVMISPDGSYILRAAPEFAGSEAKFKVTMSDGCITSAPVSISVKLRNDLLSTTGYGLSFACLSEPDGVYDLALPQKDDNGDNISWSVIKPENGQTAHAYISTNGTSLEYRPIDSKLNENYKETVMLSCTDGWMTGESIPFEIKAMRNAPPQQVGRDTFSVSRGHSGEFNVELSNDHEQDVCVISDVISCTGGKVRQGDGWDELKFIFEPDGSTDECEVTLLISENDGGNTAKFTYTIDIE